MNSFGRKVTGIVFNEREITRGITDNKTPSTFFTPPYDSELFEETEIKENCEKTKTYSGTISFKKKF